MIRADMHMCTASLGSLSIFRPLVSQALFMVDLKRDYFCPAHHPESPSVTCMGGTFLTCGLHVLCAYDTYSTWHYGDYKQQKLKRR